MKNLKLVFYSFLLVLFVTACKSTQTVVNQPNFEAILSVPAKKMPLEEVQKQKWLHLDIGSDSIAGMSLEKAYTFLEGKKSVPVIVAIADSGIDIEHEDLKQSLWINADEVKGNNIDDDKNGYVDDIYGWNFLGNKKGDIVIADQLEITRLYKQGKEQFGNTPENKISASDSLAYQAYKKYEKEYKATIIEKKGEINQLDQTLANLNLVKQTFAAVKKMANKDTLTLEVLDQIKAPNLNAMVQVKTIRNIVEQGMNEWDLEDYLKQITAYSKDLKKAMQGYDLELNDRFTMGDDVYDITDAYYGNANVIGNKEDEKHGSHVAGIVAASRNNGKGAVGVANNVQIMSVRIVPDGDEHDKDVALGIRYAVDNGAKIINTSFGKRYSPNKEWVYEAIAYAAEKDVLIVNAAGNDGKNIDVRKTYPTDSKDLENEYVDNVLTIGASSLHYNEKLPATFSNYGKKNVDIFAPGVEIYSTTPKDTYEYLQGTSMAAPAVSGVAALIRGYYPNLSAKEVKKIIMQSGVKINFEVIQPGSQTEENPEGTLVPFADLSVTGRIVNAYNALLLADYISKKK